MTDSEDFASLNTTLCREDKVAFARFAISVVQETELWRRAYGPVQEHATSETYEALINASNHDILEVLDLAFADLVANYQREADLDGPMDIIALDPSLLSLDSKLTRRLKQTSLDQALFLIMVCAAGDAAESRGLLDKPEPIDPDVQEALHAVWLTLWQ